MSDKHPNLDSLFVAASEIESAEDRAAFLDKACGENTELRQQVEQLLHSDEKAGSFLNKPPAELDVTLVPDSSADQRAASLQAGLAAAFGEDQSVIMGIAGHSVLKSLSETVNLPRVLLRDVEGEDPIVRPKSPEVPPSNSNSRYQLQGEIARGGMGAILKGRDTDLGRDLAIKVLLDTHKNNPQVIQRFIEEAQIGGQLQHPGIAPIFELGQFADKRPFFAMKLVKGETLAKLLADRKSAADERGKFIGIFEQICQTMAYAHSRRVIHRDLKPANIMVGAFGEVQVMDWGLAKVLSTGGVADEKRAKQKLQDQSIIQTMRSKGSDIPGAFGSNGSDTQMGSVMGTPAYMPPEQALGEIDQLDQRADVFGLGAILTEILTGKPPYVADDGTQVYRMASRGKLNECLDRLDTCGADADLIALAKHCLELEPADRPKDAGELAQRVTEYQDSVETKLRETELQRASEAARVVEQKKRLRVTLALAAAVVTMLLGGGSFAWWQNEQVQLIAQREARNGEAVAGLLDQCKESWIEGDTAKAAVALDAARKRSDEGGAERFSAQLESLTADLSLVRDLDTVDQFRWTWVDGGYPEPAEVATRTREALARFEADLDATLVDKIPLQVAESAVKERIIAAMDQLLLQDPTTSIRSMLRQLDTDKYRNTIRDAVLADDKGKIAELGSQTDALQQPPGFAAILGQSEAIPIERRRELLKWAVLQQPDELGLLMTLGSLFMDDIDERLRWGQAAVSARPESAVAQSFLANALYAKKDVDGAIACGRKSIELSPNYAIAHMNLGSALREKGDLDGAEAELQIAVDLYPTLFATHNNLGAFLCDNKKDFEGAIVCFRRAIELCPDFSPCHSNLGHALAGKGDIDGAIAAYRKAIELGTRDAMDHLKLASRLIGDKGEFDDGILQIRAAIQLDPKLTYAHYFLGVMLEEKDLDGAIASYRKAVELDPKDADYQKTLGAALYRSGQWQEASEALLEAIGLGKDKPHLWLFLAMTNWQLDEKDTALDWYKRSLEWRVANEEEIAGDADLQSIFKEAAALMGSAQSEESEASAEVRTSSREEPSEKPESENPSSQESP